MCCKKFTVALVERYIILEALHEVAESKFLHAMNASMMFSLMQAPLENDSASESVLQSIHMKAYLIAFFQVSVLENYFAMGQLIDFSSFKEEKPNLKEQSNG